MRMLKGFFIFVGRISGGLLIVGGFTTHISSAKRTQGEITGSSV